MKTQKALKKYLAEIKKNDQAGNKINSFLELRNEKELLKEAKEIDEKIAKGKAGKLAGKIIGVKANINVKGMHISCASKTLEDYKATYDATVVSKIKEEDGLIIGMLNMDEFASGSSGETSAFGPTKNPQALELIPGGSSSGPAAAVSAGFCDMALGSDTGGSIRNPASHCGIVGLKPSYGAVSRYGLIDLAMSLDQIGPFANSIEDAKLLFDVIKGRDDCDSVSRDLNKSKTKKDLVVGILDLSSLVVDEKIVELINNKVEEVCKKNKYKTQKVKIENLDLAIETYYPIVYVEAFSGTRKLDGRRYGKKIEESCGPEFLRRILGGSEITKAEYGGRYYYKALKVKNFIGDEFAKAFNGTQGRTPKTKGFTRGIDIIICPTVPKLPHKIGSNISVEEMYAYDALTCPLNLAGNCAISVPVGKIDNVPVGMQLICNVLEDDKLLDIAKRFE